MKYEVFFLILVLAHEASAALEIRCTTAYCTEYITDTGCSDLTTGCQVLNSTNYGTFMLYPDVCNCCDYCLTNLYEGDECVSGAPGQLPPSEICGPELACTTKDDDQATCQTMTTDCALERVAYDEKRDNGTLGSSELRPECDNDGLYSAAHCIPGSICYCKAPTGERIFGEIPYLNPWNQREMSCGCSLNAWRAQNTLDPTYHIPVARCLSNGRFDPVQCMNGTNATCLCIDSVTGAPITDISTVNVTNLAEDTLSCFDSTIHTNGTYNTTCEEAYDTLVANGVTDIELLPSCQIDGKYERIQYSDSKKICADPNGVQIDSFEALTNATEATIMDCNCARTRWILSKASVTELPTCCDFGNFEAWQCRRNECFCVDENGNQIGHEVAINDLKELTCYITNGGDACLVS
ncbi:uncharacterized protein LOC124180841 isoform X1 [Neodiprion fabricii]|uniref:uncharacterized protein LOC124180841 isoform X1 n=1 Tax=Neodiprion fabricii TaxID=2872261 RepID=UPI001ED8C6E6|nr:uncharacterized protein LOC124180841 isoform X1 [Neodiprion fabricii]